MYPPELTEPMRGELATIGVEELRDAASVDAALGRPGSCLLLVNSVCGCAAGCARPGLGLALADASAGLARPDQVVSVFAGVDSEATAQARRHFPEYPPSSPSMVLLVDGEVQWFLHRHQIEGRQPEEIAQLLQAAFASHC
jgi:putative YphP/YqiW family bacilliredoxin